MSAVQCPRPDKEAFSSPEEARARYTAILHTDPKFGIYQCVCGKWHGGNSWKNERARVVEMSPVPRLTTTSSFDFPMSAPRPRRRVERHNPTTVRNVRVNPIVWKKAMAAACGEAARIEVLSATQVHVHNDANWRKLSA